MDTSKWEWMKSENQNEYEFSYRKGEITTIVLATDEEQARKKLMRGSVVDAQVHFESTWHEGWTLEETHS